MDSQFKQHTGCVPPAFMVGDDRWSDSSWGNDSCASAEYYFDGEEESDGIRVWIDYSDPAEREYEGETFAIQRIVEGGLVSEVEWAGDDVGELEVVCRDIIAASCSPVLFDPSLLGGLGNVMPLVVGSIAEEAEDAFWAVVTSKYPEVRTGDLDPEAVEAFEGACSGVVAAWLEANCSLAEQGR